MFLGSIPSLRIFPALIANVEVPVIDVLFGHPVTVIFDSNHLLLRVNSDIYPFCISIPRIRYGFGEDGRDITVEVQPQVIQHVETERHLVWRFFRVLIFGFGI
jgi:hypothetical protein